MSPFITENKINRIIRVYYLIGAIGFLIPFTRGVFMFLTPFGLFLNFIIGMYFEGVTKKKNKERITFFLFILITYTLTFLAELAGVNTGMLFGNYTYQSTLGIKLCNTPLIIGINWIIVFTGASSLSQNIKNPLIRIFLTSVLMVLFDWIMEQVAPFMKMWEFTNNIVPINNYMTWFIISTITGVLKEILGVRIESSVLRFVFIYQFVFFLIIYLINQIIFCA